MKIFRIKILFMLTLSALSSFGQGSDQVEMADVLRRDGKIYSVVFGLVVILTAMIILLIRVDRRLFRLERQRDKEKDSRH